jgi:hypothetical protein
LIASDEGSSEAIATESDLRGLASPEFSIKHGHITGEEITQVMNAILGYDWGSGPWIHVFAAPTSHQIEIAMALSLNAEWQKPKIRLDYGLLAAPVSGDLLLKSTEAAVETIGEMLRMYKQTYGPRGLSHRKRDLDQDLKDWPPLSRYFDLPYLQQMVPLVTEEAEETERERTRVNTFGLHTLFAGYTAEPVDGGSIVIIAGKKRIQELVDSPIVTNHLKVARKAILELNRLPRSQEEPEVQFWQVKTWGRLQ